MLAVPTKICRRVYNDPFDRGISLPRDLGNQKRVEKKKKKRPKGKRFVVHYHHTPDISFPEKKKVYMQGLLGRQNFTALLPPLKGHPKHHKLSYPIPSS